MRVLVTGATGFIGAAVTEHLRGQGEDVVALDRRPPAGAMYAEAVQADMSSAAFVDDAAAAIGRCDAVVHAAAIIDMNPFKADIVLANCLGTQQALHLARRLNAGVFVYLSSVQVIGTPGHLPVTEDHPVRPLTAYHASKLFGEHMVHVASGEGFTGTVLRLTSPVGPGMPDGRILSVFVKQSMVNGPIRILGRGTRMQNYVDVRDIAPVVGQSLQRKIPGVFHIAGTMSITNVDLAERCIRLLRSASEIRFSGTPDPEEGITWDVSIQKAVHALGYHPQHDIDSTILALRQEYADRVPQ